MTEEEGYNFVILLLSFRNGNTNYSQPIRFPFTEISVVCGVTAYDPASDPRL